MAGGSSGGSPGGPKKARIEIIPLIDVVFFLLATFVLFTLSLNKSEGLSVSLPASATSEPRDPAGSATITIAIDGSLGWNKEQISEEEFIIRLETYKRSTEDPRLLINGDENALFSRVRYVFDQARRLEFKKILLETRVHQPGQS